MSSQNRKLTFSLAINEAITQMMEKDPQLLVIGQGVKSPWYVGSTCKDLIEKFGEQRVIDTPVSENAMTGAAIGAAMAGTRSIVVHPRVDFMLYGFDPIINQAANWYYMNGGSSSVPTVIWGIINRGGEQAAQHSQALHALFAHIPGLKVVMPSTPYDAKGLMVAAINDPNPVIFIDDRWLYGVEGEVPTECYQIPIGQAVIRKKGSDITVVANSYVCHQAHLAATQLEKEGISVELVDLRSIKPLDHQTILKSVAKTGHLLAIDGGWKSYGVAAEVIATVCENMVLESKAQRLCLPDIPAPAARTLEAEYYINSNKIIQEIKNIL